MKRFFVALGALGALAVCLALTNLSSVSGQNGSKFRRSDRKVRDQYIVVLKNDADSETEAIRLTRAHGGDRNGGYTYNRALKGFSVRMSEQQAMRMANDPRVEFVEEDGEVEAVATQT